MCLLYWHRSIPSNLVSSVLSSADFLVAVGNSVSNQVPSKIFEYISFGKPIIYFFEVDDDSNLEILKKYPNSICIKQEKNITEESTLELKHFCENNNNRTTPFEKVAELYPDALPEYTASLIESILEEKQWGNA